MGDDWNEESLTEVEGDALGEQAVQTGPPSAKSAQQQAGSIKSISASALETDEELKLAKPPLRKKSSGKFPTALTGTGRKFFLNRSTPTENRKSSEPRSDGVLPKAPETSRSVSGNPKSSKASHKLNQTERRL